MTVIVIFQSKLKLLNFKIKFSGHFQNSVTFMNFYKVIKCALSICESVRRIAATRRGGVELTLKLK